ncbi:redoxin domain-containing protein [Elizabethkingia anophelis]|uniref:thioredoxin family protein n=1 Tax=Elizabethkingia anophelis TaxID=1117645 RepID=UPI00136A2EE9|nr:thioredoxin family protein [Elizabethkingia anophelis]MYZ59116.1 redoxin domain-containing protein [Elizabethkingia anophelis]
MRYKILISLFWLMFVFMLKAQSINLYFPHFAGQTYEFIIFQGSQQKTVYQDTIPPGGRFSLTIPKEYFPYTGMSRWLITGTREGGGVNMFIPGKDFSVSSESSQPNEDNIVFSKDTENKELNNLYKLQDAILDHYEEAQETAKSYEKTDKEYAVSQKEILKQKEAYKVLHQTLITKSDYVSQFTQVVNITRGLGTQLQDKEEERADNIADFIANELNWQYLYTSGLWNAVISSWLNIHTRVLKDPARSTADFQKIASKINSSTLYIEFAGDVAKELSRQRNDDCIGLVAPIVTVSGKVTAYVGPLTSYINATVGSTASDLVVTAPLNQKKNKPEMISMKASSKDFSSTLLVFYKSDDTNSMEILKQLSAKYEMLKASCVRIIALSADSDEKTFRSKSQNFPWEDTYCNFKGSEGENFKNYAVTGAPTLILTDAEGKIISRGASLSF